MKKIFYITVFSIIFPLQIYAAVTNTTGGLGATTNIGLPPGYVSQNENPGMMTVPVDQTTTGGIPQSFTPTNYFNDPSLEEQNENISSESFLSQIVPLNKIGLTQGDQPLNKLFNQLFYVGLIAAVILAIVMIIRGGVEYMTIDAISSKENGKNRIKAALGGLLLAFSAIVILNTINPGLTSLNIKFEALKQINSIGIKGSFLPLTSIGSSVVPGSEGSAQLKTINNADQAKASADGVLTVNGKAYSFRSGGGGYGYLPPGTYTVTNGRLRNDVSSMVVDGYGYSFDLSDSYDSRVDRTRTLLRIHPDGGNPGTLGCIGIQGNRSIQESFYKDLNEAINKNGGKYTITVGK